jgi:hypothetical protein
MIVDKLWAQILLRLIHDSYSSKLRLGILIGVRNTTLLFNCNQGTLGHLVLSVPLLDFSAKLFFCLPFVEVSFCFCSFGNLLNVILDLIIALLLEPVSAFMCIAHTHYIEDRNVLIFVSNSTALGYDFRLLS